MIFGQNGDLFLVVYIKSGRTASGRPRRDRRMLEHAPGGEASNSSGLTLTDGDATLHTSSSALEDTMPAIKYPELYLCVDGGGTSVKVAIASKANNGAVLARATGGPCNV